MVLHREELSAECYVLSELRKFGFVDESCGIIDRIKGKSRGIEENRAGGAVFDRYHGSSGWVGPS